METKRAVLGDLEKENFDFVVRFQAKANEKDSLRGQICEIEHLIRQLRHEVEQTNIDSKRIQITVEKEDELLTRKQTEEKRVVKAVCDDIKDQIKSLEESFNITQATQAKQEGIEKHLKLSFDKAQKELDRMVGDATKRREELIKELEKVRQETLHKQSENETARGRNRELEHEVSRLENYAN